MGKVTYSILGALLIVAIFFIAYYNITYRAQDLSKKTTQTVIQKDNVSSDYVSYSGETGKTAQELLMKEQSGVKLDASGMVSTIANRTADANNREYWAFYVNGKMSSVGAAAYITNTTDKIEWKIEEY